MSMQVSQSIKYIFIHPNYKTTKKMKYNIFLELPPVCTVHQLIMIGKMDLRRKRNPPECLEWVYHINMHINII